MGSFTCCLWWFLLGALAGWLANWLLCRKCGGSSSDGPHAAVGAAPMAVSSGGAQLTVSESASPAPESALHRLVNTRFYHEYHAEEAAAPAPSRSAPMTAQTLAGTTAPAAAIDVAAARAAGLSLKGPDDLTVVEGIGPKIAELLRARGITTFAGLAAMTPPGLQAILDAAGANFKLAVPQTWPEQAALAAQNRWTELKALQDRLVVGVRPVE